MRLSLQPTPDVNLQTIFDRIRVAIFKHRIRSLDFFRDFDSLRSGIITASQFVTCVSNAVGKQAQLSRPEIQKLVEFYRVDKDRVASREFCDMLENSERTFSDLTRTLI